MCLAEVREARELSMKDQEVELSVTTWTWNYNPRESFSAGGE